MPLALLQQSLQRPQPLLVPQWLPPSLRAPASPQRAQRDLSPVARSRSSSPVPPLRSFGSICAPARPPASPAPYSPRQLAAGCRSISPMITVSMRGSPVLGPVDATIGLPHSSPLRNQVRSPWAFFAAGHVPGPTPEARKQMWEAPLMHNFSDIQALCKRGQAAGTTQGQLQVSAPDLLTSSKSPQQAGRQLRGGTGTCEGNGAAVASSLVEVAARLANPDLRGFNANRVSFCDSLFGGAAGQSPPQGRDTMRMDNPADQRTNIRKAQAAPQFTDIDSRASVKRAPGVYPPQGRSPTEFGPTGQPSPSAAPRIVPATLDSPMAVSRTPYASHRDPEPLPKQTQLQDTAAVRRDAEQLAKRPPEELVQAPQEWRPRDQVGDRRALLGGSARAVPQEAVARRPPTSEERQSSPERPSRLQSEELALLNSRACGLGLGGAEIRASRSALFKPEIRHCDQEDSLPPSAAPPQRSTAPVAPAGGERGRQDLMAEVASLEPVVLDEDRSGLNRSIEPASASAPIDAGACDVACGVPRRQRPSGIVAPASERAGWAYRRDSAGEILDAAPWTKASNFTATKKKEIFKWPVSDWIKAEASENLDEQPGQCYAPDHLGQILALIASDARARTEAREAAQGVLAPGEKPPAGQESPPQPRMQRGRGAPVPGTSGKDMDDVTAPTQRRHAPAESVDTRQMGSSASSSSTRCSLIGATIAQLSEGGAPRTAPAQDVGATLDMRCNASLSYGAYDIDFTAKRRLGEFSRDFDGNPRDRAGSSSHDRASSRDSRRKASGVPPSPSPKAGCRSPVGGCRSPSLSCRSPSADGRSASRASSRCLRSTTPTGSWRDIGLFETRGVQRQASSSRSLTPLRSRKLYESEYMPAPQPFQDEHHQSVRPLERIQCDLSQPFERGLPTPLRQRKESPAFAEDVVLSGCGPEGSLQALVTGNDFSGAKKQDYLKGWAACGHTGLDIDRTYKLKCGEFSPNYGGDRSRGSRGPGVSREASVRRESSQVPVAPGDEAAGGNDASAGGNLAPGDAAAGGNKAENMTRSPAAKNRQSWREVPGKSDMALLGRNPYQNVNFKLSEGAQRGGATGSGSGSGNGSVGNSLSLSACRDDRSGSGTDSVMATVDFENVSGSASTSASAAAPRPLATSASEARRSATPPSKPRSGWGESGTPVSSPQLGTRSSSRPPPVSSPQLGTRSSSRLAGRNARSSGAWQDFWN